MRLYLSCTVADGWWLKVYRHYGDDCPICEVQGGDLAYVLAKGEVMVKDWLIENEGGY